MYLVHSCTKFYCFSFCQENKNTKNKFNIKAQASNDNIMENNETSKRILPPTSEMIGIELFVKGAVQSNDPTKNNNNTIHFNNHGSQQHKEAYKAILDALKGPNDPIMIWKVLLGLRTAGCGSVLNSLAFKDNHAQLLHLIIRFVSTIPPKFEEISAESLDAKLRVYTNYSLCDAHFDLLLAIVSAKSTHVVPILTAMWKLLTSYGTIEDEEVINRIHRMISNVLRLVPKSNADLYPIIASKFPFWLRDKDVLVFYTIQAFRVAEYAPTIRRGLFELLIDKCVEIDVNIFIKDNGDAIIDTEDQTDANDANDANDINLIMVSSDNENLSKTRVDILSDKLDALLVLLFLQIHLGCKQCGAKEVYYELLPIFESTILTTHKSKFVQFCMLLPCGHEMKTKHNKNNHRVEDDSLNEPLYREFVSKLLQTIVDPYRSTSTRSISACYLASFVSRASFVGVDTVCESISALVSYAEAYVDSLHLHAIRATDARLQSDQHSLFYTVCQAAFYIMCFRGNEAVEYFRQAALHKRVTEQATNINETSELEYPDLESINLDSKRWSSLCDHPLRPLRFCLESVRSEFLHMAHFYSLIDEMVLKKLVVDAKRLSTGKVNKKAASSISTAATLECRRQTGGIGGLGRGSNPLKSFFPFDPILLRNSHKFIEPLYRDWQGPVEEDDLLIIDEDPIFGLDQTGDEDDEENIDDDDIESLTESSEEKSEAECFSMPSDTTKLDAYQIKLLQQKAWTETTKRPRSQSMENGSW